MSVKTFKQFIKEEVEPKPDYIEYTDVGHFPSPVDILDQLTPAKKKQFNKWYKEHKPVMWAIDENGDFFETNDKYDIVSTHSSWFGHGGPDRDTVLVWGRYDAYIPHIGDAVSANFNRDLDLTRPVSKLLGIPVPRNFEQSETMMKMFEDMVNQILDRRFGNPKIWWME